MKKLFGAAAIVAALTLPAVIHAQQAPAAAAPSPLTALQYRQDLGLSDGQVAQLETVKASLQEAHRVHCAPMHAATTPPTPAQEETHHREMKAIGDQHDARAAAVLTSAQLASLARLAAANPPAAAHHDEHAEGAGHSGQHPR